MRWGVHLVLGMSASLARAQADAVKEEPPALALKLGDVWLTPLLGPGYTPEQGFVIGGGGMVSWKSDALSPRSSVVLTASYGTVGAANGTLKATTYFLEDRLRIDADALLRNQPDHYFGIGFDAGSTTPRGDETTRYHRLWFQVKPQVLLRLVPSLFLGALFEVNALDATELNPAMAADPIIVNQGTQYLNAGMGPVLRYDSRDFPQNAYRGVFLQAQATFYGSALGGDFNYSMLDIDYRQYQKLGRTGRTLAWTARTRHGVGNVPWSELPSLGSLYDLRGYRTGQYRDETFVYAIAEYRHMFTAGHKPDGSTRISKHGFVVWGGGGTLGPDYGGLSPILVNVGVGYRFSAQDRLNLRIDYGIGRFESHGFYINFGEAF